MHNHKLSLRPGGGRLDDGGGLGVSVDLGPVVGRVGVAVLLGSSKSKEGEEAKHFKAL